MRLFILLVLFAMGCSDPECPPPSTPESVGEEPVPAVTPPAASDEEGATRSIAQILAQEGRFSFSDGASVYTLERDHRFHFGPTGMSGRTIEGKWTQPDRSTAHYQIFGRWRWINGFSGNDDYRRMTLDIREPYSSRRDANERYETYFVVEEVVPITAQEYEQALARIPGPPPNPH